MRILVVEDDEVLREGLDAGLSLDGHTVDLVETCSDAREAVAGFSYDALVVDIGLPDGSGRSEEHTSELQSLMRISYAVFCLKKKNNSIKNDSQKKVESIIKPS